MIAPGRTRGPGSDEHGGHPATNAGKGPARKKADASDFLRFIVLATIHPRVCAHSTDKNSAKPSPCMSGDPANLDVQVASAAALTWDGATRAITYKA